MFFSVLAFHVKVAALGILSGLGVPSFDLRLHVPEFLSDALLFGRYTFLKDEIPLEQIARFVRGVYFALRGIKNATS